MATQIRQHSIYLNLMPIIAGDTGDVKKGVHGVVCEGHSPSLNAGVGR